VISAHGPPARILNSWHAGLFEMIVSYELLHELETVLLRDWFRRKLTVSDVLEYVLWLREGATLAVNPARTTVEEGVSSDPDDDYLYALSLESAADLVSGDPHLLELGKSGPVRVFSPREFIEELERSL
jgi:putative PIN family toxin of toxin-antitoxin system